MASLGVGEVQFNNSAGAWVGGEIFPVIRLKVYATELKWGVDLKQGNALV